MNQNELIFFKILIDQNTQTWDKFLMRGRGIKPVGQNFHLIPKLKSMAPLTMTKNNKPPMRNNHHRFIMRMTHRVSMSTSSMARGSTIKRFPLLLLPPQYNSFKLPSDQSLDENCQLCCRWWWVARSRKTSSITEWCPPSIIRRLATWNTVNKIFFSIYCSQNIFS